VHPLTAARLRETLALVVSVRVTVWWLVKYLVILYRLMVSMVRCSCPHVDVGPGLRTSNGSQDDRVVVMVFIDTVGVVWSIVWVTSLLSGHNHTCLCLVG
jgi:uncharacterized membrane protein